LSALNARNLGILDTGLKWAILSLVLRLPEIQSLNVSLRDSTLVSSSDNGYKESSKILPI
jgi:hypothetical protein